MGHEIVLSPEAVNDLADLPAHVRSAVRDAMETHLWHEPARVGKGRIKRLRGLSQAQYRLRVGDVRVFYDVTEETVEVLGIVPKSAVEAWLKKAGET